MARLPMPETLTARQREVLDAIADGPRGGARGPFAALLRSPELCERAQLLGAFCRFGTSLGPRLSELAILVTAREWTAQYEWFAHARLAREAGLGEAIVEAIEERRRPEGMAADEAAIYDLSTELYATKRVSDATYDRAVAALGEAGVVETIGVMGYYCLVSMALNVSGVELPEGEPEPLSL